MFRSRVGFNQIFLFCLMDTPFESKPPLAKKVPRKSKGPKLLRLVCKH